MNEKTIIINDEPFYKILSYDYAPIPKEFKSYFEKLQQENQQLKEELEKIKKPTIFIDTGDMEERWGEQLYQDYLEKQNKDLKDRIDKTMDILIVVYGGNDEYYVKTIEKARNILKGSENNG